MEREANSPRGEEDGALVWGVTYLPSREEVINICLGVPGWVSQPMLFAIYVFPPSPYCNILKYKQQISGSLFSVCFYYPFDQIVFRIWFGDKSGYSNIPAAF